MIQQTAIRTGTRAELESSLTELYAGWNARDAARLGSLFSSRDDLILWGTDQFERILGREEADRDFPGWIATCPPWTEIGPTHRVIEVRGELAWAADDVTGHWRNGAASGTDFYRVTTIWEYLDDRWRIVHVNVASPR